MRVLGEREREREALSLFLSLSLACPAVSLFPILSLSLFLSLSLLDAPLTGLWCPSFATIWGFSKGLFFVRWGNLKNWCRARTGCNS